MKNPLEMRIIWEKELTSININHYSKAPKYMSSWGAETVASSVFGIFISLPHILSVSSRRASSNGLLSWIKHAILELF